MRNPKTLISNGQGMTTSFSFKRYKPMPGFAVAKKQAHRDVFRFNTTNDLLSEYGFQNAKIVNAYLDTNDIINIFNEFLRLRYIL